MALRRKQTEDPARAELADARRRVGELEEQLARAMGRDQLTGSLLTMQAFRTQLELDVKRAHRYRRPLGVIVIDIDGFRRVNLSHGYGAGDGVLRAVAEVITETSRVNDLASRLGGDEFAMLLPETGSDDAGVLAQRMLGQLEDLPAGPVRGIGASIGIAALRPEMGPEQLLGAARSAAERAQSEGGARAVVYAPRDEAGADDAEISGAHGDVIAALASALQERDQYTGDHSESVVDVAAKVGESLALDAESITRLRTASLLHDIGKVGVPDHILHKPAPLDANEWEIMRQHPIIGERILRAIPGLGAVAKIVRHEHERWDGKGYPDGISGEEIPVGARIILVCDAYHAMTSDRPYRAAMSHPDAIAEVTRNAGSQFDPNVAEALVGYLYGRRQSGSLEL
ncbi:MAG: bifunctional diguanylate cyclase/phosphohydrolase [Solirubrobacterales bacterium]